MADPKDKMPRTASSQAMLSLVSAYDEDAMAEDSDSAEEEAVDTVVEEPFKEEPAKSPTEATRRESKDDVNQFSGSEDEGKSKYTFCVELYYKNQ